MHYRKKFRETVYDAPLTLGTRLARLAIAKGVSVLQIAAQTGASRTTVYSWFSGGTVSNAYRGVVTQLIKQLEAQ